MLWKIIGAVVVVWLAIAVLSAVVKSLIPVAILALIVIGAVTVYRKVNEPSRL